MVDIRVMREDEAQAVRRLGKKTFEWFESLFVPKPKECYVAIEGDKIVGAILYKYMKVGHNKIGYVDYLFTDKTVHGKGIGSQLVDACIKTMQEEGCSGYSAIVRDDNVGSWKLFVNRGFQRIGLNDLVNNFGVLGLLGHSFKTPLFIATGMEYYLKLEKETTSVKKENSFSQILNYLIYTILILMPTLMFGLERTFYVIGSLVFVIGIRIIAGYIGTLFSKEDWYFRVTDGGYFIPVIASFFGGIYLISGNWYPRIYRKETGFNRSLGLTALAQWISLFFIVMINRTLLGDIKIIDSMAMMSVILMIISIIPLYPVATFGGKRIYDWNKWIFGIVVLFTIVTVYFN